ncbi:MAG TPA: hypothetical protein VGX25_01155 [Actinophytocola sp.]|uniref:hypothetical protein n=1 Tax=Actinophytocola sp. TaxID=1872138 RepID=UPI002DDD0B48|nr:hypothetical protein [Actinophytocola sp.]HEV2777983.1 hypothetical protein [Actinophytocola sp.]
MKKLISVLLVQLATLLGVSGVAAARAEGNQHFFLAGPAEGPSITIAGRGMITGIGTLTAEAVELRPVDNTYHEVDLAVIGGGTLTISVDGRFDTWPFTLDPRSCTRRGSLGGNWVITASGGDLAGATGGGTFRGRFFTYAIRGPAGCDEGAIKGFVAGAMAGDVRFRTR